MLIQIINGANLNLTGKREQDIYGNQSFDSLLEKLKDIFPQHEFSLLQSNIEGELVDALQQADRKADGIILNPGGYTHTSVVIADAVKAIDCPIVEVHISNIFAREGFRKNSLTAAGAKGCISGFGLDGYLLAVHYLLKETSI